MTTPRDAPTSERDQSDEQSAGEQRYVDLIEAAPVGQAVYEINGLLVAVNPAWAALLGYEPDELIGTKAAGYVHPDDRDRVLGFGPKLMKGEVDHLLEERRLIRKDGSTRWVTSSITVERDLDGRALFFHSLIIDIHERKLAEEALRNSEIRFRTLADSLPVGIFQADPHGVIDYANPRWLEITGVPPEHLTDPSATQTVHPDDLAKLLDAYSMAFAQRRPYQVQYRITMPDGATRWLSGRGSCTYDPATGEPTGIVGSVEDVTPLIAAQEETVRLAGIIESTSDIVGIVDWGTGRLIYLNRTARELFGYVDVDINTIHHLELFTPEAGATMQDSVADALRGGDAWSGELTMRAADGSIVLVWQTLAADRTADGSVYQVSAVGRDVTARRQFQEELAWQATHDSHTGLPNRSLLLDHLDLSLARAKRDNRLVALLFLDLDHFKQVNDTLGHDAGDELLVQAATRISGVLRPSDTVARIGGDEFVVLAEDVEGESHALAIGQRIATAIDHKPFILAEQTFDVTASIGIAVSGGHEAHPEALLRDADAAMYRAKDLGRARLEVFDESMRERAEKRNELADQLAFGIEHDAITVYYQPCVDLETGEVRVVEALARWTHPVRGVLSPTEFIALAEETGLIVGLGLAVLSKACRQARDWEDRFGNDAPRVHVNLSARQLQTRNLPTLVEGVLSGTRLSPDKLCLEITESVLMDDAAAVIDTLWALKAIGVSLAIDDFGTGYSSLSYLRRFPVDVLKVDQSFIDGLGPDPEDSAIVAAIINLAASLELDAIAEGVETTEQLERLRGLGCHSAQGFLFSEPRPAAEIEHLFGTRFDF